VEVPDGTWIHGFLSKRLNRSYCRISREFTLGKKRFSSCVRLEMDLKKSTGVLNRLEMEFKKSIGEVPNPHQLLPRLERMNENFVPSNNELKNEVSRKRPRTNDLFPPERSLTQATAN
jgi:hypothetical protein